MLELVKSHLHTECRTNDNEEEDVLLHSNTWFLLDSDYLVLTAVLCLLSHTLQFISDNSPQIEKINMSSGHRSKISL